MDVRSSDVDAAVVKRFTGRQSCDARMPCLQNHLEVEDRQRESHALDFAAFTHYVRF